jgi:hypothetical protein
MNIRRGRCYALMGKLQGQLRLAAISSMPYGAFNIIAYQYKRVQRSLRRMRVARIGHRRRYSPHQHDGFRDARNLFEKYIN